MEKELLEEKLLPPEIPDWMYDEVLARVKNAGSLDFHEHHRVFELLLAANKSEYAQSCLDSMSDKWPEKVMPSDYLALRDVGVVDAQDKAYELAISLSVTPLAHGWMSSSDTYDQEVYWICRQSAATGIDLAESGRWTEALNLFGKFIVWTQKLEDPNSYISAERERDHRKGVFTGFRKIAQAENNTEALHKIASMMPGNESLTLRAQLGEPAAVEIMQKKQIEMQEILQSLPPKSRDDARFHSGYVGLSSAIRIYCELLEAGFETDWKDMVSFVQTWVDRNAPKEHEEGHIDNHHLHFLLPMRDTLLNLGLSRDQFMEAVKDPEHNKNARIPNRLRHMLADRHSNFQEKTELRLIQEKLEHLGVGSNPRVMPGSNNHDHVKSMIRQAEQLDQNEIIVDPLALSCAGINRLRANRSEDLAKEIAAESMKVFNKEDRLKLMLHVLGSYIWFDYMKKN